jgi:hypothetical protein
MLTAGGRYALTVGVTHGRSEGDVRVISICFLSFHVARSLRPIAMTYSYVSGISIGYVYQSSLKAKLA